ncbi:MAG: EAL domain-containing protein [Chloroflexi bacterium]|nr:EAL domain-containing protein [Chloroflexota bacterium]
MRRLQLTERHHGGTPSLMPYPPDPWALAFDRILTGDGFSLAFQPIVDLKHGAVVGYEALSRFDGTPEGIRPAAPPTWFEEARRLGVAIEVEARVVAACLDARDRLPANTFLTFNLSPDAIASERVLDVLRDPRGLRRIVVEITEEAVVEDYDGLAHTVRDLRSRGAFLAVDDAGAGYASLSHIVALRPDFVKLDRALVTGLHEDEAKLALAEMFGLFAGRIDAWLLAEGVETSAELNALRRIGVPLAQGFFLGRPAPQWTALRPEVSACLIAAEEANNQRRTLLPLVEQWPVVYAGGLHQTTLTLVGEDRAPPFVPVLDRYERPVALQWPDGHVAADVVTVMRASTPLADAARRAITRPVARRFDPLLCVDESGRYAGAVRLERVIEALTVVFDGDGAPEAA